MKLLRVLPALFLLAACGGGGAPASLSSTPRPTFVPATDRPSPTPVPIPSFGSPEAAMTYLAAAWNRGDLVALRHVTNPAARDELNAMHDEATNLRLDRCNYDKAAHDYKCVFLHDFPKGYKHTAKVGKAEFTVGPAKRSGWYMTFFDYCGEGDGG